MNRKMNVAVIGMAVVLGMGIVRAFEKPSADYVAAMKGINTGNQQVRAHVTAKDYAALEADAAMLKPFVETAGKYWMDKKVDDAIKMSMDLGKAVTDLGVAAKAKNDDGIAAAQKGIGGSCMGCHTAHRTPRGADGTYEIK